MRCYVKLSWFNTSEAHKQHQAYIWYEYDAMQDNKERELKIVDQSQITRYVSRFEPLLYVPAFTQKDFYFLLYHPHRTSHTGNLH